MTLPDNISAWPSYWRECYEERAGIMEFQANLPRREAERRAEAEVRKQAGSNPDGGQGPERLTRGR